MRTLIQTRALAPRLSPHGASRPLSLATCVTFVTAGQSFSDCVSLPTRRWSPATSTETVSEKRRPSTSDCSLTPLRSCSKPKTHFNINRRKKDFHRKEGNNKHSCVLVCLVQPGLRLSQGRVIPGSLHLLTPCAMCLSHSAVFDSLPPHGLYVAHQALLSTVILQARILEWVDMPSSLTPCCCCC